MAYWFVTDLHNYYGYVTKYKCAVSRSIYYPDSKEGVWKSVWEGVALKSKVFDKHYIYINFETEISKINELCGLMGCKP